MSNRQQHHQIDMALRRLKNSADDTEKAAAAINIVFQCCSEGGSGLDIIHHKGIPLVLSAMKNHSEDDMVIRPATMLLHFLTRSSAQHAEHYAAEQRIHVMMANNVLPVTIKAMRTFPNCVQKQKFLLGLQFNIVYCCRHTAFDLIKNIRGLEEIVKTMARFPDLADLQQPACGILAAACLDSVGASVDSSRRYDLKLDRENAMGRAGAIPVVLEALRKFQGDNFFDVGGISSSRCHGKGCYESL
jgi:hypothetical protein